MEDKNSREEIRELVLQCIDNIIRTKSHHLRSGWKVMFSILLLSAGDPSEKIEYLGLAILQRLLDEHLDDIGSLSSKNTEEITSRELSSLEKRARNVNADDFVGLCRASLSFLQYEDSDSLRPYGLTMRALCHTAIYADLLASHRVLPPVSGAQV
jgi:brefeldin A-inhibited guanine nucleotide-exchange protein